ncbi:CheW domain-containing protein [Stutzerimonas nitrititolerans]|uniref:CheW domain-containing protein n=1 Tax=Stutzerimonas nitrititolerans TaxID=2482751 RepID=UPI00289DBF6D|nr:CheW domain-containing protein [Stutzerimonas nitrititolerans]
MSRTVLTETRSQQALQSYLDALLQDAAIELAVDSVSQDEFQAAVLEEQLRDTRAAVIPQAGPVQPAVVESATVVPMPMPMPVPVRAEPVVELEVAPEPAGPRAPLEQGQPEWGEAPFECLLFDVAGLTLAVPLVSLGSIYSLAGEELTPLFGQPDWFLGILPCQAGNLKVLDTARWVMGDRYRDDFREGLQYVISVQGYEWGLAVHQVSRSIRLDPREVKWRSQRSQRPWLAGTVIDHMCALLDVSALAELIANGGTRHLKGVPS